MAHYSEVVEYDVDISVVVLAVKYFAEIVEILPLGLVDIFHLLLALDFSTFVAVGYDSSRDDERVVAEHPFHEYAVLVVVGLAQLLAQGPLHL